MFPISLSQPQGELWVGEVPVGEGDDPFVDRMAVQQQLHLSAGDGESDAMPLVVGQAIGEALHLSILGPGHRVVQPDLILSPAGLQLQVPATRSHHT